MGIFNRFRGGSGGYTGQPPAKAQFGGGMPGRLPPGPPVRTKSSGPPPPMPTMDQQGYDKKKTQQRADTLRMQGDQHRRSGSQSSADGKYRAATEIEERMKMGVPQLDANAMSTIKSTQGMKDPSGRGWQ